MDLSLRLTKVLEFVNDSSILVDIGSDHAYLPIAFILNNKESKAYAVENKVGPLNNAIKNIDINNLNSSIYPILSDGFKNFNITNYDTVSISGMGALNIIDILNNAKENQLLNKRFVLEANRDNDILRKYLMDNNYKIIDEDIVYEDGFYYFIIKAIKTNKIHLLNDKEIYFGPINMKKKNKLLIDYMDKLLDIYINASSKSIDNKELINKIEFIKEAKDEVKRNN